MLLFLLLLPLPLLLFLLDLDILDSASSMCLCPRGIPPRVLCRKRSSKLWKRDARNRDLAGRVGCDRIELRGSLFSSSLSLSHSLASRASILSLDYFSLNLHFWLSLPLFMLCFFPLLLSSADSLSSCFLSSRSLSSRSLSSCSLFLFALSLCHPLVKTIGHIYHCSFISQILLQSREPKTRCYSREKHASSRGYSDGKVKTRASFPSPGQLATTLTHSFRVFKFFCRKKGRWHREDMYACHVGHVVEGCGGSR